MTGRQPHQAATGAIPRYRLSPDVTITRALRGGREGAYLKHRQTGDLLRLGAEEQFLLAQIDDGISFPEIATRFQKQFAQVVTFETIEAFAAKMAKHKVLVATAGRLPQAAATPSDSRTAHTPHQPQQQQVSGTRPPGAGQGVSARTERFLGRLVFGEDGAAGYDDGSGRERPADAGSDARSDRPLDDAFSTWLEAEGTSQVLKHHRVSGAKSDSENDRQTAEVEEAPQVVHRSRASQGSGKAAPPRGRASRTGDETGPGNQRLAAMDVTFRRNGSGETPDTRPPGMLRLFDPTPLLKTLLFLFGWMRMGNWQLVPFAVFGAMIVLSRLSQLGLSFESSFGRFSVAGVLLISLLTVNLMQVIVPPMSIVRHGGRVRHFGITFVLFVIPRFAIDTRGVLFLDVPGRLAFYATVLKTHVALFSVATLVWAITRSQQTLLPDIAFVVALVSLFAFVVSALPLVRGSGYFWLTTYLSEPKLRERAFNFVFGTHKEAVEGLPEPSGAQKLAFTFYAIGSVLLTGVIASLLIIASTTALEGRYGGAGLVMLAGLAALAWLWFLLLKRRFRSSAAALIQDEIRHRVDEVQAGRMEKSRALVPFRETGALVARQPGLPAKSGAGPLNPVYLKPKSLWERWRPWVLRGLGVIAASLLTFGAFQPYSYEAGGDFAILPDQRTQVSTIIGGELVEILVREGSLVEVGEVLGRLDDFTAQYAVTSVTAELERARATLDRLMEGASVEEIRVAEEQVALTEADLPFKRAAAERADALFESGTISQQNYDTIKSSFAVALQELRTAEANLAKVRAPARQSEIRIAETEVARLEADLTYQRRLLEEATIMAPVAGRIVTENVHLMRGRFMEAGAAFLEIENHEIAQAEVAIAEADIGLVEIGDKVRLKVWADTNRERIGTVVSVAPVAEAETFGRTFRVKTELANGDGFFRPGMTGYAKIDGAEMPAWRALTRLLDRFFRIEVWGWIP